MGPLVELADETSRRATMSNMLGKRYICESCATEALCNKAGAGSIMCCGAEMKLKEAKPLPSSD